MERAVRASRGRFWRRTLAARVRGRSAAAVVASAVEESEDGGGDGEVISELLDEGGSLG